MRKPIKVDGLVKAEFFERRNNGLSRFLEGWVPETKEKLEFAWNKYVLFDRFMVAKKKDKPKRFAEYEEYVRNHKPKEG